MNLDKIEVEVKGVTPLIMHNSRIANILDPKVKLYKSLTSKRKKTESELIEILNMQWELALYWDDEIGLYMPSENLSACFHKAATVHKLGRKTIGVLFGQPLGFALITDNHKNYNKLLEDEKNKFIKLVVVNNSKVLANRPIFHSWKIKFDMEIDKDLIDTNEVSTIIFTMCKNVGLGVWRPSSKKPGPYGKFIVERLVHIDGQTNKQKILVGEK